VRNPDFYVVSGERVLGKRGKKKVLGRGGRKGGALHNPNSTDTSLREGARKYASRNRGGEKEKRASIYLSSSLGGKVTINKIPAGVLRG